MKAIARILLAPFVLLLACNEPTPTSHQPELRSGRGRLSMTFSGADSGTVNVDDDLWFAGSAYSPPVGGVLNGDGAIAQSVVIDFSPAYPGIRGHFVSAMFQSGAGGGDRVVLNVDFGLYDSTAGDAFLASGVVGTYESRNEREWLAAEFPYRYAQIELLTATGPVPFEALQFGQSRSSERAASYGRYFVAGPHDARIEVTSTDGTNPRRISGYVSGRLTDRDGAVVTLERSPFELIVPQYEARRF